MAPQGPHPLGRPTSNLSLPTIRCILCPITVQSATLEIPFSVPPYMSLLARSVATLEGGLSGGWQCVHTYMQWQPECNGCRLWDVRSVWLLQLLLGALLSSCWGTLDPRLALANGRLEPAFTRPTHSIFQASPSLAIPTTKWCRKPTRLSHARCCATSAAARRCSKKCCWTPPPVRSRP